MKKLLLILICALGTAGCHTDKHVTQAVQPEPVILNNGDSVRTETVINTVYVPVEVEVPIPKQSVSNIVEADTSHIETDVAESYACVRPDGSLYHDLRNKDIRLTAETYVPETTTNSNKEIIKEREIPVPKPYPVYVEKAMSRSEQFKLSAFWYLVGAALLSGVYLLRKPILFIVRKIV